MTDSKHREALEPEMCLACCRAESAHIGRDKQCPETTYFTPAPTEALATPPVVEGGWVAAPRDWPSQREWESQSEQDRMAWLSRHYAAIRSSTECARAEGLADGLETAATVADGMVLYAAPDIASAIRDCIDTAAAPSAPVVGEVVAGDLAAIGPRPEGKVLAWAEPRPCFYRSTLPKPCDHCYGCRERIARAATPPQSPPEPVDVGREAIAQTAGDWIEAEYGIAVAASAMDRLADAILALNPTGAK